jgi:hypothetical protein
MFPRISITPKSREDARPKTLHTDPRPGISNENGPMRRHCPDPDLAKPLEPDIEIPGGAFLDCNTDNGPPRMGRRFR